MKKHNEDKRISSVKQPLGDAYDAEDTVNKYGTYNIQPTADTKNLFPAISQGLPRQEEIKKKRQ
ncbi:MAG: hypothetical protein J5659_00535 [Clostridia bacterium]|nr:hypothetical protein [Clostridia bacterium]